MIFELECVIYQTGGWYHIRSWRYPDQSVMSDRTFISDEMSIASPALDVQTGSHSLSAHVHTWPASSASPFPLWTGLISDVVQREWNYAWQGVMHTWRTTSFMYGVVQKWKASFGNDVVQTYHRIISWFLNQAQLHCSCIKGNINFLTSFRSAAVYAKHCSIFRQLSSECYRTNYLEMYCASGINIFDLLLKSVLILFCFKLIYEL